MRYLEWNNCIADYFFNTENSGSDIYLYITKADILNIAKPYFNGETEDEIWTDFLNKIKGGLPGSTSHRYIIDKAIHAYNEWTRPGLKSIEGVEIRFPLYINYLVFLILPLIEIQGKYNANNYYDRLEDFLKTNNINQNLRNRLSEIEALWADIANWANSVNNGEKGIFRLKHFIHQNWIYVGKIFSQCVFPPRAIKKLPELFLQAGMIPDSTYAGSDIKKYLLQYGGSILLLPNSVIDTIKKSDVNELGQSIIDIARREYGKWSGESHSIDETGFLARTKRNFISSRIYLQLQLFHSSGRVEFSFRMKSTIEFAEDLSFNGIEILEEKAGYSRTLNLPFRESFQLKDDFNKWIAKFEDKDVRLFISAGSFQFSTDYWLETDTLSKTNWMYLFCKNIKRDTIINWGRNYCSKFEDETDYENMPSGYSLFRFLNPTEGIDDIPVLTIIKDKSVQLTSALATDFRTFTNDFLPEVEIINSDGTEKIYLEYKNTKEKHLLKKKLSVANRWILPTDIALYSDFNISSEGEVFYGNETTYRVITSDNSARLIDNKKLPMRDSFGRISNQSITHYTLGSNTIGSDLKKQALYEHLFNKGKNEDIFCGIKKTVYNHAEGNILLSFLSTKKIISAQEFYSAFELLYSKYFGSKNQNNNINYSKVKKASLNFFDYLGYLDYEYETKSIVVNPPQLIFLPVNKGRKLLLIGGRDAALVNTIIEIAPKYDLEVEITKQILSNEDMLLPDAITIKAFGSAKEGFGEKNLIAFAKEIEVLFYPEELVQVSLQHFCSGIDEYEKVLLAEKETTLTYEDWARYVFNPDTLQFDKSFSENFDKGLTLIEYRLRPWEFHHRLWINQKCYDVDKNWGRYLVLKHKRKNVILYDRNKEKVAIPLGMPLPRLLAESIMLLSGLAPIYMGIDDRAYRLYENIPSIFIQNLFDKLRQKTIDHNF